MAKRRLLTAALVALLAIAGWLVLPPMTDVWVYGDGSF